MTAPRLSLRRMEMPAGPDSKALVELAVQVPTDLEVVEEAVDLVARHCLANGLPPRAARFNLRVALSEALANAIVYGNRLDPEKCVAVRVVVTNDALSLHVEDQGDGFDPATVPDPTCPETVDASVGRGLFLIRQLVDEVQFNERGNSICMIMRRA